MALQKQNITVNFAQGIDTKTDPLQISPGKFLKLQNSIFTKGGLNQKRNGYDDLTTLPQAAMSLSTFKEGLVALGQSLQSYDLGSNSWVNNGDITPVSLSAVSLVRTATSQSTIDVAVAVNNLCCEVWLDANGTSYYQISNALSGQVVVAQTALIATAVVARVFTLGNFFVITYLATVSAATHMQYIAIPIYSPSTPGSATDISTVVASLSAGYDGAVANNTLYLSYSASDGGGAVRTTFLTNTLSLGSTVVVAGHAASRVSLCADLTTPTPTIWVTFFQTTGNNTYTIAYSAILVTVLALTTIYTGRTVNNHATVAVNNVMTIISEIPSTYPYTPNAVNNYTQRNTVTIAGVVGSSMLLFGGTGLASKAFYVPEITKICVLIAYGQAFQPTYFLVDSTGHILAKLAYSNGKGYNTTQVLPSVSLSNEIAKIGYLFVDLVVPVNKERSVTKVAGVYTQTGINLVSFDFTIPERGYEIGSGLHLTGGYLRLYDGIVVAEHGFHVWPEDITVTTITTGGSITDQQYNYQVTYEWTDAQGNIHRSAPSIPTSVTTAGGGTSTNTINVPYLRLTGKTNVRLVLYRWSTSQPVFYQVSSASAPVINNPLADSIAITDTLSDAAIIGNTILYTTGGVVEDIAAPATNIATLSKSRLFVVDAENPNLIWYSKTVIQSTPVEMSDLFTLYVSPVIGAQGASGPITALSSLDDKLIIFKENGIYYITGQGPDNTGANNDFSDPVFVTGTVGCTNQGSIVNMQNGLMFQSNKGIWLLGRDLNTRYIGAPAEDFNAQTVNTAVSIPGSNDVRFMLDDKEAIDYDYYYDQWNTFGNIPSVSSVIFGGLHTYLSQTGLIRQETPGLYLDGSVPVNRTLTTGWISLAGLQGYERVYQIHLLGTYISPHTMQIGLAYDYNPSIVQEITIHPINFDGTYGSDAVYGSMDSYGGNSIEQWRIFPQIQKCQAFQITIVETFDATLGTTAGAGFTLSGLNLVVGIKKGYAPKAANQSAG